MSERNPKRSILNAIKLADLLCQTLSPDLSLTDLAHQYNLESRLFSTNTQGVHEQDRQKEGEEGMWGVPY